MSGTARYLKEKKKTIQAIAVDPEGSVYYDYFKTKNLITPHPYLVEGIGEDMLCQTLHWDVIDDVVQVTDKEAFSMARELAKKEGIFAGGSSGAAVWAALELAKNLGEDQTLVVILPDSGARYLSKLYNDDWMKKNGFIRE